MCWHVHLRKADLMEEQIFVYSERFTSGVDWAVREKRSSECEFTCLLHTMNFIPALLYQIIQCTSESSA